MGCGLGRTTREWEERGWEGEQAEKELEGDSAREGKIGVALRMDFRGESPRRQYGNLVLFLLYSPYIHSNLLFLTHFTSKMPKSRRDKDVSLTKVKKTPKENKQNLVQQVQKSLGEYQHVYVYNIDAMRSAKMVEVRQQLKESTRFFFGKNGVMAFALGRDAAAEKAPGLHKISNELKGQCGLMFTNLDKKAVKKFFEDFSDIDYARAGQVVDEEVKLDAGPLPQFAFSVEPQLRKLGLPVKLEKGEVQLINDFTVCKAGDKLNPEQAKILKLLDHKLSEFKIKLVAHWSEKDGFSMINLRRLCVSQLRPSTSLLFSTKSEVPRREVRFSETGAYQGTDRREFNLSKSTWNPDYYSSDSYRNKRLLSAILSLSAVLIYFGLLREPNDLDDILNAPPHLLASNLERRMLYDEIEKAKKAGKDTSLLEAELEYVIVKEAALKVQFDNKKK
ncbi:hypothetical protein FO519_005968 [Halicephalobus sp. NKZ332]|nr:hypothetical protein FO519_005968 [Halicephalobus sp. NKZ332]